MSLSAVAVKLPGFSSSFMWSRCNKIEGVRIRRCTNGSFVNVDHMATSEIEHLWTFMGASLVALGILNITPI